MWRTMNHPSGIFLHSFENLEDIEMRTLSVMASMILFGLVMSVSVPNAKADTSNWDSYLTFSQPVEIPGMVLPAGTYEFRLADPIGNDTYVVEVLNSKGDGIALFQALPQYRGPINDKTVVTFESRGPNNPEAIKEWTYPDHSFGLLFSYPPSKDRAAR
jgi:hypothetical protein